MKKIYLLLLLGICMPAAAEMVSTISYNPSRLGKYSSLKVSRSAAFLGGLDVKGDFYINNDVTFTNKSQGNFYFKSVEAPTGGDIDMRNQTVFHNSSNWNSLTNAASEPSSFGSLNIEIKGGNAAFSDDSFIRKLSGENLYLKTPEFKASTSLKVAGNEGMDMTVDDDAGEKITKGLFLAGNDIPVPVDSTIEAYELNTRVYRPLKLNESGCELKWVKRQTQDKQNVWVLALADCELEALKVEKCTNPEGTLGEKRTVECFAVLGAKYWGNITLTCKKDSDDRYYWEEDRSGCKEFTRVEPSVPNSPVTCFTGLTWKTAATGTGATPDQLAKATWRSGALLNKEYVKCNGISVQSRCPAGQACDCTPGETYVYRDIYTCQFNENTSNLPTNRTVEYGYWCATCEQVSNVGQCVTAPLDLNLRSCKVSGLSSGRAVADPVVNDPVVNTP